MVIIIIITTERIIGSIGIIGGKRILNIEVEVEAGERKMWLCIKSIVGTTTLGLVVVYLRGLAILMLLLLPKAMKEVMINAVPPHFQ